MIWEKLVLHVEGSLLLQWGMDGLHSPNHEPSICLEKMKPRTPKPPNVLLPPAPSLTGIGIQL